MTSKVAIIGIGMHAFGRHDGMTGLAQGAVAARRALEDAGLRWSDMQFAVGGSVAAGSADSLVSELGLTGVGFRNVHNGCATGGSSLLTACEAIESGRHDVGLVVGFDKHPRGAFAVDPVALGLGSWYGTSGLSLTSQFFALKLCRYLHDSGINEEVLAAIAERAFANGALNPMAWRRTPFSKAEIQESPVVHDPLRKYMFCSPSEGGVALVVCRSDLAASYSDHPVNINAVSLVSRNFGSFEVLSPSLAIDRSAGPTVTAAESAFAQAGITPSDVDIAQVQDTDSGSELIHLHETGLIPMDEQEKRISAGETSRDGRLPVNTDGGCIASGEPIGASGLRQIHESVLQLRGTAGDHQVGGQPKIAFTHVYGAPGISSCAVLSR